MSSSGDREKLHDAVISGNLAEVQKFIANHSGDRRVYNFVGESSLAISLKQNQLEVYELLMANKFEFGTHEKFNDIAKSLSENAKAKVREIHVKLAQGPKLSHMLTLFSKFHFHNALDEDQKVFSKWIFEVFAELNEVKWIELILKVVACSEKLKIIFDFNHDSVNHINPMIENSADGSTNPELGIVLIGAKGLTINDDFKDEKPFEVMAVIAHELCHYALQMLHDNRCKPYAKNDNGKIEKFLKVLKECESNKDKEKFIAVVFSYPECHRHAELIVRVPHLLALYKDDSKKLQEVKQTFKSLFDFYEEIVDDMKTELPLMEAKMKIHKLDVIPPVARNPISFMKTGNFQTKVNANDNIQFLESNCPQLTINAIFHDNDKDQENVFMKLEDLKHAENFNFAVKAHKLRAKPTIIIDCNSQKVDEIEEIVENFKAQNLTNRLMFVVNQNSKFNVKFPDFDFVKHRHKWSKLTTETQATLLKHQVNFQGTEVPLKDMKLNEDEAAFKALPMNRFMSRKEVKVGKEIKFPEVKIHVERKFLTAGAKMNYETQKFEPEPLTVGELIEIAEQSKTILLADQPGNGKSTEFKVIAKKLKEKFPSRWVAYIDLKQFTKVFQENGKVSMNFDVAVGIATFLAEKILKLEGFETEIFVEMFKGGRVMILMDGVDEISPSYNEFVLELMTGIKYFSKNRLWIATRPHLVEELEEKLKTKAVNFLPFNVENRGEFFKKLFEDKAGNVKETINAIEKFLEKLKEHSWYNASVVNPLLLQMIAEFFDDDLNFQLADADFFSIYDEFVNKMIRKLAEKGPEAKKDSTKFIRNVSIIECHQKKAIEMVFGEEWRFGCFDEVMNLCFKNTPELTVDQMTRIGLTFADKTGKIRFTHRTFAEFFAAHYIVENLLKQSEENEKIVAMKSLLEVLTMPDGTIRKFVDSAMENAENVKFSDVSKIIRKDQANPRNFFRLAKEGCVNLVKFVSLHVIPNRKMLYELWFSCDEYNSSVVMAAANHQPLQSVLRLLNFATEIFTKSQVRKLLLHENLFEQNLLNFAVENKNDEKVFEFFVQKARESFKVKNLDRTLTPNWPFWHSRERKCASCKVVVTRCKQNFTEDEFKRFLKSTSYGGSESLLHYASRYCDAEDVQIVLDELVGSFGLSKINEFLRKILKTNRHFAENTAALMSATRSKNVKNLETLWRFVEKNFSFTEQREILLLEDYNGLNALNHATLNENKENFEFIAKVYEGKFTVEEFKEILVKENKSGRNILWFATTRDNNVETVKALWTFLQKLIDDHETLKRILARHRQWDKLAFCCSWDEEIRQIFEPFILQSCTDNTSHGTLSVWFIVATFHRIDFIENLFAIVDQNSEFATSFNQNLFDFQNENSRNILQCAHVNWRNTKVLNFFLEKAKIILSEEEISIRSIVPKFEQKNLYKRLILE